MSTYNYPKNINDEKEYFALLNTEKPDYRKPYHMIGETEYHTYKIKSHFKNETEYLNYIRNLK